MATAGFALFRSTGTGWLRRGNAHRRMRSRRLRDRNPYTRIWPAACSWWWRKYSWSWWGGCATVSRPTISAWPAALHSIVLPIPVFTPKAASPMCGYNRLPGIPEPRSVRRLRWPPNSVSRSPRCHRRNSGVDGATLRSPPPWMRPPSRTNVRPTWVARSVMRWPTTSWSGGFRAAPNSGHAHSAGARYWPTLGRSRTWSDSTPSRAASSSGR